jgi:glycoprotein 3-alpha-L-fucosyltransferase
MGLNGRQDYIEELQKYISVDVFGSCGPLECSRLQSDDCFQMLRKEYKFYLAFENSNCRDYITEKLFVNALRYVPYLGIHC